jgi:putative mRNA 3-end processing factor
MLGSSQIRVEASGEVWVVSGDYKVQADPTCTPIDIVPCHTFVTEATYGLPVYRWPPADAAMAGLHRWWAQNQADGLTSVVFAYALGKAQRVLAELRPDGVPILLHGGVVRYLDAYRASGLAMPAARYADDQLAKAGRGRALVLAPPSAAATPWLRKFAPYSTAFASGWMAIRGIRRRRSVDRGFVLSDHADWDGLMTVIRATGATRIGVTHGYTHVLTRWLTEQGLEAFVLPTQFEGERGELSEEKEASSD